MRTLSTQTAILTAFGLAMAAPAGAEQAAEACPQASWQTDANRDGQ